MPDYKEMYLTLFRATEQATNTLIAAQRSCEELYLSGRDGEITLLSKGEKPSRAAEEGEPAAPAAK